MSEAVINGTTLYYERVGSGLPCIALHGGLGMDHTYFKRTFGPLEDVIEFIYLDQRGNGRSARPSVETITMHQLADDVDALREHLGMDKVALLGHSYGGFVSLEYATTRSDKLSHLILLDTSPGGFEPTEAELAERPDPATVSLEAVEATSKMFARLPETGEEFLAGLPEHAIAYMRHPDSSLVVEAMRDAILDIDAMRRGFEILPTWSVADKLDRITCPTLVFCGRYDLQTTPECAKRIATKIPGAELAWFENSGHFPWLEEPDAFFAAIKDFLARHP